MRRLPWVERYVRLCITKRLSPPISPYNMPNQIDLSIHEAAQMKKNHNRVSRRPRLRCSRRHAGPRRGRQTRGRPGQRGIQTYRNPRLVNVFDKLGLIENFGTGIPRTLEAYAPFGEKPEFKPSDHFFIVHLPNLNSPQRKQPNASALNDQINDRLNDETRNGPKRKRKYTIAFLVAFPHRAPRNKKCR